MSKTVIQMAKEAGFPFSKFGLLQCDNDNEIDVDQMLERLVELARADERANLAEQQEPVKAMHVGFDWLDNKQLVATYAVPVATNLHAPDLYTSPQPAPAAPVQPEPDKHQEYIDSLSHDHDSEEKMLTQIHHWARQSYSRHQQSVRGQMITAADSSDNHIIWAALRWAKESPSPQAQPAQRTWVGLMRGARVEGDTVVITVKGGNDAARELCGALLEEKNT